MDLIQINLRDSYPSNPNCQKYAVKLDWCQIEKDSEYFDNCSVVDDKNKVVRNLGDM